MPKATIAIVDDEPSITSAFARYFNRDGRFEVSAFTHPNDFLSANLFPDVVITDMAMPSMDGIAMLESLCARGKAPKMALIASGIIGWQRSHAERVLRLVFPGGIGIVRTFDKPMDLKEVLETVSTVVP
jgi:DNA-binding NtrC family response regulator